MGSPWPGRVGGPWPSPLQGAPAALSILAHPFLTRLPSFPHFPRAAAIEADSETFKVATVSQDLRMAIQQARQAKKLTQKELANQLMIQASVINDYESGRAVPNPQLISKLERALGCVGRLLRAHSPKRCPPLTNPSTIATPKQGSPSAPPEEVSSPSPFLDLCCISVVYIEGFCRYFCVAKKSNVLPVRGGATKQVCVLAKKGSAVRLLSL